MVRAVAILFSFAIFFSCIKLGQAQERSGYILLQAKGYNFPYDLTNPDKKTKVPSELREISGIQHIGNGTIAAIEDEHGKIYLVDFKTGEIKEKIRFGDNGDYEDLEIIDNDAWILKSNGNLYRVKDYKDEDELKTKKYETELSKKNDFIINWTH